MSTQAIPKKELVSGGIYRGFHNRNVRECESEMIWDGSMFFHAETYLDENNLWPPSPYDYYEEDNPYACFRPVELIRIA